MTPEEENRCFLGDVCDRLDELPQTRDEAKRDNQPLFRHHKGCRNGHIPIRNTATNRCAVCQKRGCRNYFLNNKEKVYKSMVEYQKKRYKEDSHFKAKSILRDNIKRLFRVLKTSKSDNTFNLLGYTVEEFLVKIEEKFEVGMSWENHGDEWQLDHIIPIGMFYLRKKSHFDYVNSIENLQPLWNEDHFNKSAEDRNMILNLNTTGEMPDSVRDLFSILDEDDELL